MTGRNGKAQGGDSAGGRRDPDAVPGPVVRNYAVRPPTYPQGHWMNRLWGPLSRWVIGTAIKVPLYRFVLRAEPEAMEHLSADAPLLFACIHQDILDCYNGLPRVLPERSLAAMVSYSRDGDLAGGILRRLGYEIVRGSSSRGGTEGLLALRCLLKGGTSVLMASDGPKAPLGDVKAGIVKLAAGSGVPILPVRAWGAARYRFRRSWTRASVTVPLLPVAIRVGAPIRVPAGVRDTLPYQRAVSRSIARLAVWTARWAGDAPVPPYSPV